MRIRLSAASSAECDTAVGLLAQVLDVTAVSYPYPDRTGAAVRVYLHARLPEPPTAAADGTCAGAWAGGAR